VTDNAPLQVLIVERQALERRLAESILDDRRLHDVVRVGSVAEARALMAQRRFDVVVTDESRLRAVLDGLFAFVGVFSVDGVVVDVNRAPLAVGNLKVGDVVGHRFVDLPWFSHSPAEKARVADALARAARGETLRFDTNIRRMIGGIMYVDASFAPLRDASGTVTHILGSGVDVTARHEAEAALALSQARLEEAQRAAHVGSWEWDANRDVAIWSEELYALYGVGANGCDGTYQSFLARAYPPDRELTNDVVRKALAHPGPFSYDHRILRPDGAVRMLHTRGEVVTDSEGRPLRLVGSCWDITEVWESRQQLRALTARLDAIREDERRALSREIHDRVGQDLTALKLDLGALRARLPPGGDPELQDRAARMEALLDRALATARRVAADLRHTLLEDLGLPAAIEEQARDFQLRTGVPCTVTTPADMPELAPNVALTLFRILQEGLTNVARHAQARRVAIRLSRAGDDAVLTVEDDGRGITAADQERRSTLGLVGMRERALVVGGSVTVAPGSAGGTALTARIPLLPPVA
jgi:PAS domain S-box-containing protein